MLASAAGLLAFGASQGAAHAAPADPLAPSGRFATAPIGTAPTPPMGWNSWNAFGVNITEARLLGAAQGLVDTGLAAAGYRYVNIDDGWWRQRRAADGRMQARTNLFPSAAVGGAEQTSLRPFTDRLHAMGLKAGLYTDIGRNACSQAWSPENPNLPEGTQAEREVGLYGHVAQDLGLYFRDWNFDFIKVDACGIAHYGPDRALVKAGTYRALGPLAVDDDTARTNIPAVMALYGAVRDTLTRVRPAGDYVLSLCNWGAANVRAWGRDYGTMWRTSTDIDATWGRMLHTFDTVATREFYAGPGHWNDPDMLEVGNGQFDANHLTEARSQMSLWAMAAAPLLIGTDLAKAPPAIIAILGARGVIAIDQDPAGNQATIAYADSEREILVKTLSRPGTKAVALVNRSAEPTDMTLSAAHLKMAEGAPITLSDAWGAQPPASFTATRSFHLAPHETLLFTATGTPALGAGAYLSEMPARVHVAVDGIGLPQDDPMIHRMIDPYHPSTTGNGTHAAYAGWGAPRADFTPYDQSLRIAGGWQRYGLGVLAGSRLEVRAEGQWHHFTAEVGIDDTTRERALAVRFELWGDKRLLAASAPCRFGDAPRRLEANLAGVRVLELVARPLGAGMRPLAPARLPLAAPLLADWGGARVE